MTLSMSSGLDNAMAKQWTSEETQFLRNNFRALPAYQIARVIGRTQVGVENKAYRLRLSGCNNRLPPSLETRKRISEAHTRNPPFYGKHHTREAKSRISEAKTGLIREKSLAWKGDEARYGGQHTRAIKDFPEPLGICRICGDKPAVERARIEHTNLAYRKEYVLPMCNGCNQRHSHNQFVIFFKEAGNDEEA